MPSVTPELWPSLSELCRLLDSGVLSAALLVERSLDRIGQAPGSVYIEVLADRAREAAQASDARRACGRARGPLDGVPYALKDVFNLAGRTTTAGSLTRRGMPPAVNDAAIVQRLDAAGLIPVAVTGMSELAFSGLGVNPHFGTPAAIGGPESARGVDRAPGGSSSGSALAVARGDVPFALGSDTSGSMRVPAAWNGVVGLRPSMGRYPMDGVFPLAPALDVAGPMASSVEDAAWIDALLAGHSGHASRATGSADASDRPQLWAVEGMWTEDLADEVRTAWSQALLRLENAGWRIAHKRIPAWEEAMALQQAHGMLVSAQAAQVHAGLLADPGRLALVHGPVRERLLQAAKISALDRALLLDGRERLCREWSGAVGTNVLVLLPTTAGLAPPIALLLSDDAALARENMRALRNTFPGSFVNAPSLSVPLARGNGAGALCDMGLMLCAAADNDEALLRWGAQIRSALDEEGRGRRAPGLSA